MADSPRARVSLTAMLSCGLITALLTGNATASGCSFEDQGEGRVSATIDARTFVLEDGREVRLAGIEPVATGGRKQDGSALAALVAGRDVTLRATDDTPDRYGRQVAFVFLDRSDVSVQELLLAKGSALVSATVADKGCAADLIAAEVTARRSRLGTWVHTGAIIDAESPGDILAKVGQFAVVEGRVLSVRQAGATYYVNFGRRWTRDFAVTISRRMMPSFEAAGFAAKLLENKRIQVRGWVEIRGGPRIQALRVGQLDWAGDH